MKQEKERKKEEEQENKASSQRRRKIGRRSERSTRWGGLARGRERKLEDEADGRDESERRRKSKTIEEEDQEERKLFQSLDAAAAFFQFPYLPKLSNVHFLLSLSLPLLTDNLTNHSS